LSASPAPALPDSDFRSRAPRPGGPPPADGARPFSLARLALAIVAPTIVYASLRPFSGWRDRGRHPFAYLMTAVEFGSLFDALLNVVGYLLFAACLVLALYPRVRGRAALALGSFGPIGCSALVEAVQTYLPGRFPSLVDLGMNSLGALLGAALAVRCTPWLADHRGGRRLRERWLVPGRLTEVGLLLLTTWFVALFAQRTLLFGLGDVRGNLQAVLVPGVPVWVYAAVEVVVVAANLTAAALVLRLLLAEQAPRRAALVVFTAAALAMRMAAQLSFWKPAAAWQWATPTALAGVVLGVALAWQAVALPRRAAACTALALLAGAVIVVNVAPPDPALWQQPAAPRERVMIGLALTARYVAKAWPLAAAGFLLWLLQRDRRRRVEATAAG
jgi:VanZ family protein